VLKDLFQPLARERVAFFLREHYSVTLSITAEPPRDAALPAIRPRRATSGISATWAPWCQKFFSQNISRS
jgi:hypothetical protein